MNDPFANAETLDLLIDSASFEESLSKSDGGIERLLDYQTTKMFHFSRSQLQTAHPKLKDIPQFETRSDETGRISSLEISRAGQKEQIGFWFRMEDINLVGKTIFKKESLSSIETSTTLLPFIQAEIRKSEGYSLLVTRNDVLLTYGSRLESHFPGGPLNVIPPELALEIMDLFAKARGDYFISSNYTVNKGYWYWLSFRSKVRHYHVSEGVLGAFASRFTFLLMALDEIGIQRYLAANNDTIDNSSYHFNYLISLISGIFDSLAIATRERLGLTFEGQPILQRTSLYRSPGEEFRKALKGKNQDLWQHIRDYEDFLELILALRQIVLHREGLSQTTVEYRGDDARWRENFLKVSDDVMQLVEKYEGGSKRKFASFRWGGFILPHNFSKALVGSIAEFSDRYLELLGFSDFLQTLDPSSDFSSTLNRFLSGKLGS